MADPTVTLDAHNKYGRPLAFTPSESSLVTGGFDGTVTKWAVDGWEEMTTIRAHEQSVNCGATTAGGTLVTGSTDTTVKEWNLDSSEHLNTFDGHSKTVAGLATHPTQHVVASASYDATVRIWKGAIGRETTILTGHPRNVTSVEFVSDGSTIASGGIGDALFIWSFEKGEKIAQLGGHGEAVTGISVGVTDNLWTAGYDGSVHQFDIDDWTEITAFDLPDGTTPSGIDVHPDDDVIAITRDGGTLVVDSEGVLIEEHQTTIKGISSPMWSPDGVWLAVGGADGNLRLYD